MCVQVAYKSDSTQFLFTYLALTAEQKVVAHAMSSMIENHLSWVVLWWRAKYPDSVIKGYQVNLQNALNTRLPNPILNFCYKLTSGRKVCEFCNFFFSS